MRPRAPFDPLRRVTVADADGRLRHFPSLREAIEYLAPRLSSAPRLSESVSASVPPALKRDLRAAKRETGASMADIVRLGLARVLPRRRP